MKIQKMNGPLPFLLVVLIPVCFLSSCKKQELAWGIEYNSNVTVPNGTITGDTLDLTTGNIVTDIENECITNGILVNDLETASVLTCYLLNPSSATATLAGIASADVFISASGLPEIQIASRATIPAGDHLTYLDIATVNILNYIKSDQFTMRVSLVTDSTFTQDLVIQPGFTVEVRNF
jgi:hypothetical protein